MRTALWLLTIRGAVGAFDTLHYHGWRARLPSLDAWRREPTALAAHSRPVPWELSWLLALTAAGVAASGAPPWGAEARG